MMFAEIPEGAVFGDGKEGVYRKVTPFRAAPNGFRSHCDANAFELEPGREETPAWFAQDCEGLVYPLRTGTGVAHD